MNDLLLSHEQRQNDKRQIIKGSEIESHEHSQSFYFERQRQRQKRENAVLNHLKKGNRNFNTSELKKTFLSHTIIIMNAYLKSNHQIPNPYRKEYIHSKTTESSEKSEILVHHLNEIRLIRSGSENKKYTETDRAALDDTSNGKTSQDDNSNFYQIYINLFVNFFNHQSDTVNLSTIKSIIRPNNRFVIIDLLKALLEFCRNHMKLLIKDTVFYQNKSEPFVMQRNNTEEQSYVQNEELNPTQEAEMIVDFQSQQKLNRRVQTEPQVSTPRGSYNETRQQTGKISPSKPFRTKNSVANFIKHSPVQQMKQKQQQSQQVSSRYLQAHFIDTNIKQTLYQKNYEFVTQINLQKVESRINSIYIELNRLNVGNNEIISKYYEENLGKKNKFNYDQRGLYSESQILAKKQGLIETITEFEQRPTPSKRANSVQLTQYALEFSKYKNKCEELNALNKSKNRSPKAVSNWIPLKIQYSLSILEPLKVQIQDINPNTGQVFSYHWKKYKKEFCITDFLKGKVKAEYQKIQQKHAKIDKTVEKQFFKKKKFRKSLFLDNRKKMNDLIQSNNVIFTKKQSIFPVLKGIQQNYIKNSTTMVIQTQNYALDNNFSKSKDIRIDLRQQQKLKYTQNLTSKAGGSSNYPASREKQKRFESIKKVLDPRQKSERKYSDSDKVLQKIPDKEKNELLARLSVKYDLPVSGNRTQKNSEKYEKKNLISMSKMLDIRSDANTSETVSKMLEISISPDKKLTILNLS